MPIVQPCWRLVKQSEFIIQVTLKKNGRFPYFFPFWHITVSHLKTDNESENDLCRTRPHELNLKNFSIIMQSFSSTGCRYTAVRVRRCYFSPVACKSLSREKGVTFRGLLVLPNMKRSSDAKFFLNNWSCNQFPSCVCGTVDVRPLTHNVEVKRVLVRVWHRTTLIFPLTFSILLHPCFFERNVFSKICLWRTW